MLLEHSWHLMQDLEQGWGLAGKLTQKGRSHVISPEEHRTVTWRSHCRSRVWLGGEAVGSRGDLPPMTEVQRLESDHGQWRFNVF